MDNNEQFGDFTIMDGVVNQLMGDIKSANSGGPSFPVMEPRTDDDEDDLEDDNKTVKDKITGGFKDERTVDESQSGIKNVSPEDLLNTDENNSKEEKEEEEEDDTLKDETIATKKDEIDNGEDNNTSDDIYDLGEDEPEITAYVQERLFEKMGWELEGEEKPYESMEDLVDYMEKIIEANSIPTFASKDIEDLNKFVTEGGDLRDYFKSQGELDLTDIDLTVDYNQKAVVKEYLKEEGYSDAQVMKKINRYDESGILEDEAIEAKESLEKVRKEKSDKLLKDQELYNKQVQEQQQKFYNDVSSTIDSLDNIQDIKLTKLEKEKLKDAMLKVGSDGKTEYQKTYQEDLIKNFIESAFFTMKKGTLIKKLTSKAESKATQNLKKKLETKTKRGRTTGAFDKEDNVQSADHSALNAFSSRFMRP